MMVHIIDDWYFIPDGTQYILMRKYIVNAYSIKEYKPKFCSECGQKLKW